MATLHATLVVRREVGGRGWETTLFSFQCREAVLRHRNGILSSTWRAQTAQNRCSCSITASFSGDSSVDRRVETATEALGAIASQVFNSRSLTLSRDRPQSFRRSHVSR